MTLNGINDYCLDSHENTLNTISDLCPDSPLKTLNRIVSRFYSEHTVLDKGFLTYAQIPTGTHWTGYRITELCPDSPASTLNWISDWCPDSPENTLAITGFLTDIRFPSQHTGHNRISDWCAESPANTLTINRISDWCADSPVNTLGYCWGCGTLEAASWGCCSTDCTSGQRPPALSRYNSSQWLIIDCKA